MVLESNGYGVTTSSSVDWNASTFERHRDVAVMFQFSYGDVAVVSPWCHCGVTMVLHCCYSGVTLVLPALPRWSGRHRTSGGTSPSGALCVLHC
jgi:hypothetical protein